jgi:hypothetical protein
MAQQEANRLHVDTQKPLVRITAQPGMSVTGLAGLEVWMPGTAPIIQQQRPNEWVGVVSQTIGVIGAVGGIYAGGKAAEGLLNSAAKFVQPSSNISTVTTTNSTGAVTTSNIGPVTNTTTGPVTTSTVGDNSGSNSGNSGRLSGTTMTDSTSIPTVVTQPVPLVVTQPAPLVVTQPSPVIVQPSYPPTVTP